MHSKKQLHAAVRSLTRASHQCNALPSWDTEIQIGENGPFRTGRVRKGNVLEFNVSIQFHVSLEGDMRSAIKIGVEGSIVSHSMEARECKRACLLESQWLSHSGCCKLSICPFTTYTAAAREGVDG